MTNPLEADLSTLPTLALFERHREFSRIKVLGNALLHGPKTGTAAAAPPPVTIEKDPDRLRLIELGLHAVVKELQRVESELHRRPSVREVLFPGISKFAKATRKEQE